MPAESEGSWLIEKHISPWVLPKEQIVGFVKWRPEMEISEVSIRAPENIRIVRLFDVDENLFAEYPPDSLRFTISQARLQIPGFVGFEAFYETIPDGELDLTFQIDLTFRHLERQTINLATDVIRPVVSSSQQTLEIFSSPERPDPKGIQIALTNKGKAEILEESLEPFIEIMQGKELKIQVSSFEDRYGIGDKLFVKSNKRTSAKIMISGKGYGMIRLGFNYSDRLGNRYKSSLLDVLVTVKERKAVEIPIGNTVMGVGEPTPILEPAVLV